MKVDDEDGWWFEGVYRIDTFWFRFDKMEHFNTCKEAAGLSLPCISCTSHAKAWRYEGVYRLGLKWYACNVSDQCFAASEEAARGFDLRYSRGDLPRRRVNFQWDTLGEIDLWKKRLGFK